MKFGNVEIDDNELVRLWYSDEPMIKIAANLNIDTSRLLFAWRRLKREGKLPVGDRPKHEHDFDPAVDGRPSVLNDPSEEYDPLLDALKQRGHNHKDD